MAKKSEKKPTAREPSFEESLERLEGIVDELEDGRVALAEGLDRYEEGVKLLKQCHALLDRAERRIERLTGVDQDGQPMSEPFDRDSGDGDPGDGEPAESLEEKAKSRGRRRSATRSGEEKNDPDMDVPGGLF